MDQLTRQKLLDAKKSAGILDMVLDTDTFNEVDDQYALSYLLHAPERLNPVAFYAAPFANEKAETPAIGMQKSYDEILHILSLNDRSDLATIVFRGSEAYLPDEATPVLSDAAQDLVVRSRGYSADHPLFVVAIGACTNIASALLLDPTLIERTVIIWLGGNSNDWHDYREFNLRQDVAAARILMGCGGAVVQIPAYGVASALTTPIQEVTYWLDKKGPLCEYLLNITLRQMAEKLESGVGSRKIWDISTVAYLLDRDGTIAYEKDIPAPVPEYDHSFSPGDAAGPMIRQVYYFDRDRVFRDLYHRLTD